MSNKNFLSFWLPVILYAAGIFIASSISKPPAAELFPHCDKVYHIVEYGIFGFLLFRALDSSAKGTGVFKLRTIAVILAFVYAVTDELHQHFVPGRSMEFMDLLADTSGAFIGQWFFRMKG